MGRPFTGACCAYSISPCLARLGRRSDVTPCDTSVTVHSLFRRAWTTHHWEDHPTPRPSFRASPYYHLAFSDER
jgi:hypothetical protein